MTEISLYWWRPALGDRINVGDEVNKHIVEHLSGRPARRDNLKECEVVAIGSVLQGIHQQVSQRPRPIHVWGSGTIVPEFLSFGPEVVFHAVRGPLTRCLVGQPDSVPLGDPGILVSDIFAPATTTSYAYGIFPHFTQLQNPVWTAVQEETKHSVIIDPTDPDIASTFDLISRCERIVSTSLHGVIFADAYKIPNLWLDTGDPHRAGSFKFYDYFASIGRKEFRRIRPQGRNRNLASIAPEFFETQHFANVDAYKKTIAAAFPAHLKAGAGAVA